MIYKDKVPQMFKILGFLDFLIFQPAGARILEGLWILK